MVHSKRKGRRKKKVLLCSVRGVDTRTRIRLAGWSLGTVVLFYTGSRELAVLSLHLEALSAPYSENWASVSCVVPLGPSD